jgi:hypothetical protein
VAPSAAAVRAHGVLGGAKAYLWTACEGRGVARVKLLVRRTPHAPRFRAANLAYLHMATASAAARAGAKRGRGAQPPAGTRVWAGAAPSDSLLDSLQCPICIDVFQQARCSHQQQRGAQRGRCQRHG